jgi:hypothetical protein
MVPFLCEKRFSFRLVRARILTDIFHGDGFQTEELREEREPAAWRGPSVLNKVTIMFMKIAGHAHFLHKHFIDRAIGLLPGLLERDRLTGPH